MLNVNLVDFSGMSNDIAVITHVGNLETLVHFNLNELDPILQQTILSLIQVHVDNMPAQELINKLAK